MKKTNQKQPTGFHSRKRILCIALAVVGAVLLLVGGYCCYKDQQQAELAYHATYLILDDKEYRRDSVCLDLSGSPVGQLEKIKELTQLQQLDLRSTGLTETQFLDLQAALPNCEILWSVPFQGSFLDCTTRELVLEQLDETDLHALAYFPDLTAVNADRCTDYGPILTMQAQYPDLTVSYLVTIGDENHPGSAEELIISDPDLEELARNLPLLPMVHTVYLQGMLPENSEIVALKQQFPGIQFSWDFELLDVPVNSLDTFVDLSRVVMKNTEALEAMLPCFYNLEQVDMIDCGIHNDAMEALNQRHPGTKFVWRVAVSGVWVRTDAKYFMPWKHKLSSIGDLSTLKYCHDMECLDFGHKGIHTFEFVEHMPKLRFLLVLDCYVQDLSSIAACTSLEFLELAQTPIYEYWPLINLTNLTDLNISSTPHNYDKHQTVGLNDTTMLYQFTMLDRLWFTRSFMSDAQKDSLRAALPDTQVTLDTGACTTAGWRYSPNYYEHRDIMDMWYMVH